MITKEDLKKLIARIKAATGKTQRQISVGAGYGENSLSELAAQKNGNYEPAYRQLELVYGDILKNSTPRSLTVGKEAFTADQLFHMYMKAMERQDKIMDAQTVILNRIDGEMARETTLARMDANLKRTLAAALTVAKDQEDLMKQLRALLPIPAQRKAPSAGVGKEKDQIDVGLDKTGKHPA